MTEQGPLAYRERIAMVSLKGRLSYAIRIKRTDSFALTAARGWAARQGVEPFKTMKQALAWVEARLTELKEQDND
jgi:hypothetical protein